MPLHSEGNLRSIGSVPGSIIFTGNQKVDKVKIHYLKYNVKEYEETISEDTSAIKFKDVKGFVDWYDLRGLHNTDIISEIGQVFKSHPLALEDIADIHQRPRYDEYDDGILLLLKSLTYDKESKQLINEHIAIYFNDEILLSFQEDYSDVFKHVRSRIHLGKGKIRQRATDYLAYSLLDNIVDSYYIIMDDLQLEIEFLEDSILEGIDLTIKQEIHQLKKKIIFIRRQISPLREAISRFSKSDESSVHESTKIFLRDLYNNTVHILDTIDSQRDILNGLQDLYISEISFKMNQIMKVLTIITTLFVPLSFLAGLYGMNFENIPELHFKYGYYALLTAMLLIVASLMIWFKKKNWF